jgi:hypothetical protein
MLCKLQLQLKIKVIHVVCLGTARPLPLLVACFIILSPRSCNLTESMFLHTSIISPHVCSSFVKLCLSLAWQMRTKFLVRQPEGKRPRCRWHNITVDLVCFRIRTIVESMLENVVMFLGKVRVFLRKYTTSDLWTVTSLILNVYNRIIWVQKSIWQTIMVH